MSVESLLKAHTRQVRQWCNVPCLSFCLFKRHLSDQLVTCFCGGVGVSCFPLSFPALSVKVSGGGGCNSYWREWEWSDWTESALLTTWHCRTDWLFCGWGSCIDKTSCHQQKHNVHQTPPLLNHHTAGQVMRWCKRLLLHDPHRDHVLSTVTQAAARPSLMSEILQILLEVIIQCCDGKGRQKKEV